MIGSLFKTQRSYGSEDPDAVLLRDLRGGSRRAFERLLDRYEGRIYQLALRMLDTPTEAEDATQEIFLEVHRSLPRFRGDCRLDTWLHRVAVNVCLQRRRRRKPPTVALLEDDEETAGATVEDPFTLAAHAELRETLERSIRRLPEGQREVILLHGLQGLSLSEVALVLGVPVGTVKSRLSTAFRRLRVLLAPYVESERSNQPAEVGL